MAGFADLYLDYRNGSRGEALLRNGSRGEALLLWPVWVWAIHAPDPRHRPPNLFEKTVLGLVAAGRDAPDWIGERLGIEAELVRYIVAAQLTPNGWMDARGRITDAGRKQLDGDAAVTLRLRAGYLFQSTESGELWPRFSSTLSEIEPVSRQAAWPEFRLDRDSGRTFRPFLLKPRSSDPPECPSASAIWEALRRDRIARHNERQRGEAPEIWEGSPPTEAIEFIEPEPRPAYVLCRVHDRAGAESPWLVSDPLGRSPAVRWMRQEVYTAAKRVPPLAERLQKLLGEVDEALSWDEHRAREDETVRLEVFQSFPTAERIPGLTEALVELLRTRETVGRADRRSYEQRQEEVDSLVMQCQKVLERCCQWCLTQWPMRNPGRISKGWRPPELEAALRAALPDLAPGAIGQLRGVRPGKVFWAVKERRESLRPLLVGVLLSLADHAAHPFRALASDQALMKRLLVLSRDRDGASHGGEHGGRRVETHEATAHADTAQDIVKALLQGS